MNKSTQFVYCGDYVFLEKSLCEAEREEKARYPQELECLDNVLILFLPYPLDAFMIDNPPTLSELGGNHPIAISLMLFGKFVYLCCQSLILIRLLRFITLRHSGLTDNFACPTLGNVHLLFYMSCCFSFPCRAQ